MSASPPDQRARYQSVGMWLGPLLCGLMLALGAPEGLEPAAWRTAALGAWMAVWWATEAAPVGVTAFIPLIFFAPMGITSLNEAAAPYANPILYLYLGGFLIALAMQNWNLHKRIALALLSVSGTNGRSLIGGFMLTAGLLSMWMTNTSTTMMLLPIVVSVIGVIGETVPGLEERERRNFEIGLLLGTAFGATIGGAATLVGTPPNAFLAGFLAENYDVEVTFARWMLVGLPVSMIMLPAAWLILTRIVYPVTFRTSPETRSLLVELRAALGRLSAAEWRIGIVFALVVAGWMFRPFINSVLPFQVSDSAIVMLAAFILFLLPSAGLGSRRILDWGMTRDLPWGILVLFGGGLSLAAQVSETGLAAWIGSGLVPLGAFGIGAVVVGVVILVIFLTELTSNLATTATLLPVLAALALELGVSPVMLAVPVALAASYAFMLPVATPPNAIVYGAGRITVPQMARAGILLNLFGIILLSAVSLLYVPRVLADDTPPPLDIVIQGGTVFDGRDVPGVRADVGIAGDRIVAVGDLADATARQVIDADGLAVVPGFVDVHSHAVRNRTDDSGLFLHPDAENYIRQGVTTAIGGPDGGSWLPVSGLLEALEVAPAAINFGTFVGHNRVRAEVMGRIDRAPTATELDAMRALVAAAMEDGAYGLSSGLQYIPGAYSDTTEVIALAAVAARYGGIYITHMRHEGRELLDSVDETIRIGREAGLPAQITHHKAMGVSMWGKSVDSLAMVDAAIAEGLDISSDVYPYTASSTGIRVMFPSWALEGDRATREARFRDPVSRQAVLDGIVENLALDRAGDDLGRVVIASCRWAPEYNGKSLGELLDERDVTRSLEAAAELVLELELGGTCSAIYHTMDEDDVIRFMRHPTTMIASDGAIVVPGPDVPHPRSYGAFARVLSRYVRELDALPFETAIHKMSMLPAERIGLDDRGRIEPGAFADIAVLDPDQVADRATFERPHQFAVGVRHVLVNGRAALLDGEMTGQRPGAVLRHQPAANNGAARASMPGADRQGPLRVLFVGNSFSFYNDGIHTHFRQLLRSSDPALVAPAGIKMSTISGGVLAQQGPALDLLLEQYAWDVVVLQGHSREPIDPAREADFLDAVTDLSARIRAAGARPALFQTWGYRDQAEMIETLAAAYDVAGQSASAIVAPVGRAVAAAREALPDTAFYADDGRHPSLATTYLAANVFYARLLGASPEALDYDAGLEPGLARALRRLAWETVSSPGTSSGDQ